MSTKGILKPHRSVYDEQYQYSSFIIQLMIERPKKGCYPSVSLHMAIQKPNRQAKWQTMTDKNHWARKRESRLSIWLYISPTDR